MAGRAWTIARDPTGSLNSWRILEFRYLYVAIGCSGGCPQNLQRINRNCRDSIFVAIVFFFFNIFVKLVLLYSLNFTRITFQLQTRNKFMLNVAFFARILAS